MNTLRRFGERCCRLAACRVRVKGGPGSSHKYALPVVRERTDLPLCARSERPWSVHVGAVFDGDHGDPVQMIVDTVYHAVITTAGTVKPF